MKKTSRLSVFSVFFLFLFSLINITHAQQIQTIQISNPFAQQSAEQTPSDISPETLPSDIRKKMELDSEISEDARESSETPETSPSSEAKQEAEARETLSEFEQFISGKAPSRISTNIRQFGYDLFRKPPSTFAPSRKVPVGPGYVIGPGDEIRINVWGKIEGKWNVTVDRDGNITLPKVGVIGVTGVTFSELKELLKKELSKYYTGFEMNVSMGSLRTIRIYLVGNAKQPGAYTISSLSTLVNAFIETGGPSKTGTMRDIQVKRNSHIVEHFDMYDFLMRGDKSGDIRLMPEDVIFIPAVGPLVGIAGNVNRPAIYELKGETRLLDLINMAGGLASTAFKGRVQVQRIKDHKFRTLFEGDLFDIDSNEEKNFVLKDGDLVKVFAITEAKNTATLAGAVVTPGEYAIIPGVTKIKDVITKAGGILYYASDKAEMTRIKVTQEGPQTELLKINVSKAMDGDPEHNIPLQINDYLFIRTVPDWRLYQTVSVSGEVKYPGTYTIRKGETLSSLIERAGGYTDEAYLRGAVFTRERVREIQQDNMNVMIERLERELLAEGSIQVSTALSKEEIESKKIELEQKRKFIESLTKIKATGRMSIRLAHLRLLKGSEYDLELEEGDSLFIPMKNNVVNVIGAVMSRSSFIYSDKLSYKNYIAMAGGYSRYADEDNVYVLKVDGSAMKLNNGLINWNPLKSRWEMTAFGEEVKEIEPGDSIIVPEKLERIAWLREIKDLTQILYQIAVSAAVVIQII